MTELGVIELDARLALVLGVGLPRPKHERTLDEWKVHGAVLAAKLDELRRHASAGELLIADPNEVARAVAELADVNDPQRPETVEILVELVLMIQRSGMLGEHVIYLVGGLFELGWPTDPEENLSAHMVASVDLGLFDPPDQPRRERVDPNADWELPPNTVMLHATKTVLPTELAKVASIDDARQPVPPPAPPPLPTLRERFLAEWEELLGGIVDRVIEELIDDGYIDYDGAG